LTIDHSVDFVDLDDVDELLLEELEQTGVDLVAQLGVLLHELLHLDRQQVDQVLGPGVLHWHLDRPLREPLDLEHAVDDGGVDSLALQNAEDLGVELEPASGVLQLQLLQLVLEQARGSGERSSQLVVSVLQLGTFHNLPDGLPQAGALQPQQEALKCAVDSGLAQVG
jgi:hypothetical protein